MYVTILDLVLVLLLFIFVSIGFALGLVQAIGALIGLVLGAWLGGMFYEQVGHWLTPLVLGNVFAANTIAFILIFAITDRVVGFLFYIINKIFNIISLIPFTKTINRLLGAILGFAEGILALGLGLWFANTTSISAWVTEVIAASKVAGLLIWVAKILTPLLPEIVKRVGGAL